MYVQCFLLTVSLIQEIITLTRLMLSYTIFIEILMLLFNPHSQLLGVDVPREIQSICKSSYLMFVVRYVDEDELFKHLRKEHYFCHLCEVEGGTQQFYSDYTDLRDHFR